MTTIKLKPGTWVARSSYYSKQWIMGHFEPIVDCGVWSVKGGFVPLPEEYFDLTSFPTCHEPDWRKTKFQVTE